jgi:hypothetical protein
MNWYDVLLLVGRTLCCPMILFVLLIVGVVVAYDQSARKLIARTLSEDHDRPVVHVDGRSRMAWASIGLGWWRRAEIVAIRNSLYDFCYWPLPGGRRVYYYYLHLYVPGTQPPARLMFRRSFPIESLGLDGGTLTLVCRFTPWSRIKVTLRKVEPGDLATMRDLLQAA